MIDRLNTVSRNAVAMFFWLAVMSTAIVIGGAVIFSNYVACASSFELLGYEMKPLEADVLVGPLAGALFGDATLAHLYAAAIALTIALGLFLVFHLAFQVFQLMQDRRAYIEQGDDSSARIALRLVVRDLILIGAFLLPLALAFVWDIELFRFRSVAGAMNLSDPGTAPTAIANWDLQLDEHSRLFAWIIAKNGAWGYLAVTVLACLALEFTFTKVGDAWSRLLSGFRAEPNPESAELILYGYDSNGQPVYDESEPTSFDTSGRMLNNDPSAPVDEYPVLRPVPYDRDDDALLDEQENRDPPNTDQRLPVYGSSNGEELTLAEAQSDLDRYHVDMMTREIWLREHWEALHAHGAPAAG